MKSVESLIVMLQQAEQARDGAQADHRRGLDDMQAAQAQHVQLVEYRRDYEQKYAAQFRQGGSIEAVRGFHAFMQRLTLAIEQQAGVVTRQEKRIPALREALQHKETQVAAIRKLIERRLRDQQDKDNRREQRQSDEAATRAATRNRSSMFAVLGAH